MVSISIVTYNNERYIGHLLDSISENVKGVSYHIYIIDNGSTDSTMSIVQGYLNNRLTVILNKSNLGFGKGHNQCLHLLKSRYHVIVNPDIELKSNVIKQLAEYMDTRSDIGILSPKVLYPNGNVQILPKRNPKFIYLLARRIDKAFLKKYREAYEMAEKNADEIFNIEFATGSFMFVRTELFLKVGGFDERYFMYFEDADLTRAVRRYAPAEYNPKFIVYHHWERAGNKSLKFLFIQICSMFRYMRKWSKYKEITDILPLGGKE